MNDLFPYYSIEHFINRPNQPAEFAITRFEEMEEPEVEEVHKHTFYEILWVDEGKSRQTIDYHTYELLEKSLFFISPGQVHEFEDWQPLKGGTLMFTADFFLLNQQNKDQLFELSFLDNIYFQPNLQPSADDFTDIRHTINLLIVEKQREDHHPLILQSLLHVLLLQIQRSIDRQTQKAIQKRHIVLYKQFQKLIEANFKKNNSVGDYASDLHITQHHLNRVVKEVSGKTATELVRARSLLEAKRLLTFSDLTVSEIAMELGYFDSSYFAKLFKKETGCSPLAFRASMSEKYRKR